MACSWFKVTDNHDHNTYCTTISRPGCVLLFFRIRQQRASTIYKQCEKRKANLIAISLRRSRREAQAAFRLSTFYVFFVSQRVHMLRLIISIYSFCGTVPWSSPAKFTTYSSISSHDINLGDEEWATLLIPKINNESVTGTFGFGYKLMFDFHAIVKSY